MEKIKAMWGWFLEGLTEAVIRCADLMCAHRAIQVVLDTKPPSLRDSSGEELCKLHEYPSRLELAEVQQKLVGSPIAIVVPNSFVLHRDLNRIAVESAPFIEAFARHQIERVTPWKAADTYFGITTERVQGKPPRLAVSVHVVARRLLADIVDAVSELKPSRLDLLLPSGNSTAPIIVPANEQRNRRIRIRRIVQTMVLGSFLLIAIRFALLCWQMTSLQSATAALDARIEDQRASLAARDNKSEGFTTQNLCAMRQAQPRAVETLEAMSTVLPDDAYLVSFQLLGDQLHISGVSKQTSDLVPALEGSERFVNVSFAAATTRLEDGSANRFHLSMRVVPPKAAPP